MRDVKYSRNLIGELVARAQNPLYWNDSGSFVCHCVYNQAPLADDRQFDKWTCM